MRAATPRCDFLFGPFFPHLPILKMLEPAAGTYGVRVVDVHARDIAQSLTPFLKQSLSRLPLLYASSTGSILWVNQSWTWGFSMFADSSGGFPTCAKFLYVCNAFTWSWLYAHSFITYVLQTTGRRKECYFGYVKGMSPMLTLTCHRSASSGSVL